MKKLTILFLILAMNISLFIGCGSSDKDNSKEPNQGTEADTNQDTGTEDTTTKEEEIDTSIYSEKVELPTENEKKVVAYYDPTVVECFTGESLNGSPSVELGMMWNIYVTQTATAEDFMNYIISEMGGEIGKHEECVLSGYAVHYYTVVEPGTENVWDKIYVLELDAGVALNFRFIGSIEEGSDLEKELGAIKFVVE